MLIVRDRAAALEAAALISLSTQHWTLHTVAPAISQSAALTIGVDSLLDFATRLLLQDTAAADTVEHATKATGVARAATAYRAAACAADLNLPDRSEFVYV